MDRDEKRARGLASDPWDLKERWAKVSEIAELYSMSTTAVYKKAKSGEWPSHRQGRTTRFSPDDQQRIEDMWVSTRPDRIETREERKAQNARRERLLRGLAGGIP